jgi:hypothetical protein
LLASVAGPVVAAGSSSALAQGFSADTGKGDIVAGTIVSFKANSSRTVELANTSSADRLAGVADDDPLVVISSTAREAQIVLNGTTNVLVSDINGPIHANDRVTASPIAGVGMVATADSRVVGTALADFDTNKAQTKTIADSHGAQRTVRIGSIPLQVGVAYYQAPGSNFLPPFIQDIANSVAGRPVALVRVLISTAILLFGLVSVGLFIYSSVRSAVVSMGRNPLAAGDIRKSIYQVGVMAAFFLGATLLAGYLMLAL